MAFYGRSRWPEYVPVAARRRRAAEQVAKLRKKGGSLDPVVVESRGRSVASTFWGAAWCDNLEAYSDYSNRLPRGRSYLRNGSIVDLQVASGSVTALVQGSSLYRVAITIRPLATPRWKAVVRGCSGHIASLVELLRGGISEHVMKIVTEPNSGLFPNPAEISLECSCPDWATMCKHVAASMYGVGVRLDERPELLFTLRGVDATDLVAEAARGGGLGASAAPSGRVLVAGDLSDVFGVEIDESSPPSPRRGARGRGVASVPSGAGAAVPPRAKRSTRAPRATRGKEDSANGQKPAVSPNRGGAEPNLEGRVAAFVAQNAGAGFSEIARGLSVKTSDLIVPIALLMSEGRIRTEGSGRSTGYHPVVEPAPRSRPRRTAKPEPLSSRRRTGADLGELAARFRDFVRSRPGLRMEQISLALSTPTTEFALPVKKLLAMKLIRTRGQRRATRYFPA